MGMLTMCPVCGDGYLSPQLRKGYAMVNGAKVEFSVVYSYCIDCESELMDPQDMAHNSNECAIIGTFIDHQFVKLGAK